MSAVDVLAVMDARIAALGNPENEHPNSARAAIRAELTEARAAVAELILAAENALGNLTTCGTPRPIKGKERSHAMLTAALARVQGGAK